MELTLSRYELCDIADHIPSYDQCGGGSEGLLADDLYNHLQEYIDTDDSIMTISLSHQECAFLQNHNLYQFNQLENTKGVSTMKITKWDKSLVGKTVTLISNSTGSGFAIGSKLTIISQNSAANINVRIADQPNSASNYVALTDVSFAPKTVEELKNDIKAAEQRKLDLDHEILDLNNKIEYMNENGVEEFDDEVFKAFSVMKLLKLGTLEQAKAVVAILNK